MTEAPVICGDCSGVLADMPAESIDAIVTDPPYGISNERYDSPNAVVFDPAFWAALVRVCKADAAAVAFGHGSTYHRMASAAERGGWRIKQMWLWVYRDGMSTSAYPKEGFDRLAPAMDPILFATRGKVLLNADREGIKEWRRGNRACGLSDRSNGTTATSAATGRRPKTIVSDGCEPFEYFAMPRAGRYRVTDHPNEKPVELMRWLVAKVPGEVILDPFAGSGTTGVAALAEGRRPVLIEQNPQYAELCRTRLAGAAESRSEPLGAK